MQEETILKPVDKNVFLLTCLILTSETNFLNLTLTISTSHMIFMNCLFTVTSPLII